MGAGDVELSQRDIKKFTAGKSEHHPREKRRRNTIFLPEFSHQQIAGQQKCAVPARREGEKHVQIARRHRAEIQQQQQGG